MYDDEEDVVVFSVLLKQFFVVSTPSSKSFAIKAFDCDDEEVLLLECTFCAKGGGFPGGNGGLHLFCFR